jgi:hypothetical protein
MPLLRPALLASALLTATTALAATPPLGTPPDPTAPPTRPIEGAPPVFDLSLPEPPGAPPAPPELPELPAPAALAGQGVPPTPPTLPDLLGVVELPEGAEVVLDHAPPFGAPLPGLAFQVVPEPASGALLALGLLALARRRKR